jgi:hypothetical protein
MAIPKNIKQRAITGLEILLLGINPREVKMFVHTKI